MTANDAALLEPGWREQWCEVGGARLHVIEAGCRGDPMLVLLHGFPEFWWAWRHQITPLATAGIHVVVPDLRGYNLSSSPQGPSAYGLDLLAEDVARLAGSMGSERFYLAGHDWGAVIGWCVAARYPERVRKAVLISGPHPEAWLEQVCKNPEQLLRSWYIGFFQLPWLSETILGAFQFARLKSALRRSAQNGTFSRRTLATYVEAWARPGALTAMLNFYRALRRRDDTLAGLAIVPPTLLIWGERDRFLGGRLMEASLSRCMRGSRLVVESGTHWLHLEHAELVTEAIASFIGQETPLAALAPA